MGSGVVPREGTAGRNDPAYEIERGANVLYAHLGGQPAHNAYGALFTG